MTYNSFKIKSLLKDIQQKGFFHLLSANVLIQVFAFSSQLFVAGILSPDDIGRIKIIQSYLSIFSIIAGMGFNASTLKICSEKRTQQDNINSLNAALIFTIISTIIVYFIVLVLNYYNFFSSDSLIKWLIPLGLFPLISNSIFIIYTSYLQANKEIKLFSSISVYNKLLSIIALICFSYFWGIKGYYVAYNISFILMSLIVAYIVHRTNKFSFKTDIKNKFREHWVYAKANFFASIIAETSALLDIVLISFIIKDLYEIGFYSFALTLTIALKIFPVTVQQIAIPYFSSFDMNRENFLKVFYKYNRLLYIVVFISLILFLAFTPLFVNFVFGEKYNNSFSFLIFLSIGWSIRNLNQLQSGAIFGLGKIKYNAYTVTFVLIGNLIIYPIAIYYFGIMGAAYASISSGIIMWIASGYYFKKAIRNSVWKN